jgi:DNA mismatch repair ATPase MutL
LGEVSLDGHIRSVSGVLPMALAAKREGIETLFVPAENAPEATLARGPAVIPVRTVQELAAGLNGETVLSEQPPWMPEKTEVSTEEEAFCEEYRGELESCGFEFSVIQKEISLTGIPVGFEKKEAKQLLLSLMAESLNGSVPPESTKRMIFERMPYQSSCKASVKAGRIYDSAHIRWICDNLFRYDCIKYCPHGRPVAFEISKKEIDTRFGRT